MVVRWRLLPRVLPHTLALRKLLTFWRAAEPPVLPLQSCRWRGGRASNVWRRLAPARRNALVARLRAFPGIMLEVELEPTKNKAA